MNTCPCPHCGSEIQIELNVCIRCGKSVKKEFEVERERIRVDEEERLAKIEHEKAKAIADAGRRVDRNTKVLSFLKSKAAVFGIYAPFIALLGWAIISITNMGIEARNLAAQVEKVRLEEEAQKEEARRNRIESLMNWEDGASKCSERGRVRSIAATPVKITVEFTVSIDEYGHGQITDDTNSTFKCLDSVIGVRVSDFSDDWALDTSVLWLYYSSEYDDVDLVGNSFIANIPIKSPGVKLELKVPHIVSDTRSEKFNEKSTGNQKGKFIAVFSQLPSYERYLQNQLAGQN